MRAAQIAILARPQTDESQGMTGIASNLLGDTSFSMLTATDCSQKPGPEWNTESSGNGLFATGFTRAHVFSLTSLLLAFCAMSLDMPLACWVHNLQITQAPYWFRVFAKLCDLSEIISHGQGVLLVLFGLFVLDRARFRFIPRLLSCSLLAGLLAVVCKALVVRARPSVFVSEYLAGRATESFDRWLPYLTEGVTGSPFNSFPSAHTATAIGLAIGLSWLYPHARWYFFVLAFLAACQRIVVEAHYISDILVGGAIGSAFALLCIGPGYLGRLFTWLEQSSWPTKQDKTAKATPP